MKFEWKIIWTTALHTSCVYALNREKSKKWSEQMAALVCLRAIGAVCTEPANCTAPATSSSCVNQLSADCGHTPVAVNSPPMSQLVDNSTDCQSHKRVKLTSQTADISSSAVEIVRKDMPDLTSTLVSWLSTSWGVYISFSYSQSDY